MLGSSKFVGVCASMLIAGVVQAKPITITEINLKWFGRSVSEARAPTIKAYFKEHNLFSDVMAFEEIVDVSLLQRDILGPTYECHSYVRQEATHQHVVLCNKTTYKLEIADGAADYALEAVDVTGHLRPAVHGILTTAKGKRLAHIFAVHLKAMPKFSSVRIDQINKIAAYLGAGAEHVPVVVVGDFNTYADDPVIFQQALGPIGLQELDLPQPFTWASATENYGPAKFDRVWLSTTSMPRVSEAKVVGPCSSGDTAQIQAYNEAVSDHCAVKLTVDANPPKI